MTVWLFTPSFCKWKLLENCLEHVYSSPHMTAFRHVIIDNHYPVEKEENHSQLKRLSYNFGCDYVDSGKDLGLHNGINNAMLKMGVKPGDILIGLDPDDRPSPGFIDIFTEVMQSDPDLAIACATFGVIEQKIKEGVPFQKRTIAGRRILIHPTVEMWNVAAFNTQFIFDIGGFHQPHAYYGGVEIALYPAWSRRSMYYGYLTDINSEYVPVDRSDRNLFDPEYRQWKDAHLAGFKGGFEEWINQKKKKDS